MACQRWEGFISKFLFLELLDRGHCLDQVPLQGLARVRPLLLRSKSFLLAQGTFILGRENRFFFSLPSEKGVEACFYVPRHFHILGFEIGFDLCDLVHNSFHVFIGLGVHFLRHKKLVELGSSFGALSTVKLSFF